MENNNLLNKDAIDFVAKTVDKVLAKAKVPQETSKNHILVGGVGFADGGYLVSSGGDLLYSYSFYNPHNARFYFDFDKWNFKPSVDFRRINSSEWLLKDFLGCRIVVKRSLVEVTNKVDSSRCFKIDGSLDDRRCKVIDAVATLESECIVALKGFISRFGGTSSFECVKMWIPDNKILHDKIVDRLPLDMTFRNDVVKKVYNVLPKNVEFSSPATAANAFRNLGLYDYAPLIASELEGLHRAFDKFTIEALNPLTEQIKKHLLVQDETLKTLKAIRVSLGRNHASFLTTPKTSDSLHGDIVSGGSPLDDVSYSSSPDTHDSKRVRARKLLSEWGW